MTATVASPALPAPVLDRPLPDCAETLVAHLEALGVEFVFGVPGGAVEPLFNALAKSARRGGPRPVAARHESGAAFMADGYARASGRIGVCIATSGPGATNMATGIACANENRVPLLAITGQPTLHSFGKGALQESACTGIDSIGLLRGSTRYSSLVSHPAQLAPKLFAALMAAQGANPGAAHLSIPVDIQRSACPVETDFGRVARLLSAPQALLDESAVDALFAALQAAWRPVFVVGDGCAAAMPALMQLVDGCGAEFVATPDGLGLVDPRHTGFRGVFGFGGHESAAAVLRSEPDLVVVFGSGLGELASDGWSPGLLNRRLVHVDSSEALLARSPMARLHVRGRVDAVCTRLLERFGSPALRLVHPWRDAATEAAARDERLQDAAAFHDNSVPIKPQRLMKALAELTPPGTRFLADAGNSAVWAVHCLAPADRREAALPVAGERRRSADSWLRVTMEFAPMGWAIGGAIGVAVADARAPVVCITGDGSWLMNGQEITVATTLGLPVVFVILNDGALGMVKHGQRIAGAERVAFELPAVDYAQLAAAMGVAGHVIRSAADLAALDWPALAARRGPTLLDVRIDTEEVPPMRLRTRTLGSAA